MKSGRVAMVIALAVVLVSGVGLAPAAAQPRLKVSTHQLLSALVTRGEHGRGYDRDLFGDWVDADHDGCDTRDEVLITEAVEQPTVGSGCSLSSGEWRSRYDAVTTTDPSTFDIDHLVPLAEAWQSGSWRWDSDTRRRYANDLGYGADLIAVTAHSNRSKGERSPDEWMPERTSFACRYLAIWVAVKWRWRLRVNSVERSFLHDGLKGCGWPAVTKPSHPPVGVG